jgi:superfamily II DNA or RNA helicase
LKLRYYQEEADEAVVSEIVSGNNPLLLMATGTGKTVVFVTTAGRCTNFGMKVLILAHTEELVDQAIAKAFEILGIYPDKEKAEHRASREASIVVGSVQTMQNSRLERWPKDHFQLIIVDEAHHAVAKTYQNILNYFTGYSLVGATATGDRADEKELGTVFNVIAYEYPLHKAIKEGFLAKIIGYRVTDLDIDLTQLRVSGKDYTDKQLGEVMLKYIIPLGNSIKKVTADKKTMIFMPDVKSSAVMAEQLQRIGLDADYLSGDRKKERGNILYKFKTGQISHLVSCNILLEGFDEPTVEAIVNIRPTASRPLYCQLVGRGTRLAPGKTRLVFVEFTYNSTRLNLVQPYELFATKNYPEKLREKTTILGGQEVDLFATLEAARIEWEKPENLTNRLMTKEYGFEQFDPFSAAELMGEDISGEFDITYEGRKLSGTITPKQIDILNRYGVYWSNLDKAQASHLIDIYSKNGYIPMIGKATRGQKYLLTKIGYQYDSHIMKAQASVMIDMIKSHKLSF